MVKTKKDYIAREDWKFMEQMPYGDENFSEEHNKRVIEETERWNDEQDRKRVKDYQEKTRERTNAVAQYLKNLTQGRGVTSIDRYFGKRHLAYLRAEEIVNQLKANPALTKKLKEKMSGQGKLRSL